MITIRKDNRIEQVLDTDFPRLQKLGWVEVDPKTGIPLPPHKKSEVSVLTAQNHALQKSVSDLEAKLAKAMKENKALKSQVAKTKPDDTGDSSKDENTTNTTPETKEAAKGEFGLGKTTPKK